MPPGMVLAILGKANANKTNMPTYQSFLARLAQAPLLGDGAMGTSLHQAGAALGSCFDCLNLDDPARVLAVHRAFLDAGAELIETNTYGANRYKLALHNSSHLVAEINREGVRLAQKALIETGKQAYIAGSVGPLGVRLSPYGRVAAEDAQSAFREQIKALVEAGADVVFLETFTDLNEIAQAIKASRAVAPNIPVVASMTFTRDGSTIYGDSPREVANALAAASADVIGVNCSGGPSQLARIAQIMRAVEPDALLSVMPNAGYAQSLGGRVMYPATPDYFAEYALVFRDLGVNLIGGCCGTTPEHIQAMRFALQTPNHAKTRITMLQSEQGHHGEPTTLSPLAGQTPLAQKLSAGQFITTVEMAPPRGSNARKVLAAAEMLKEAGIDSADVSDSPMARMRMSPWAVCHLIQDQLEMETILHFPTRGRNLLRVQGDLLAAHALNVRNIFVVMGDPTAIGDYPDANDKYDIVPSGLIRLVKHNLNTGKDQAGNSIGQPTSFFVGCALNLCPDDMDKEIGTLIKKLEAGADFALTQPVYDPAKVEAFLSRYQTLRGEPLKLPILAGILPLYGGRHAGFLHNEVPGVVIPENIMTRISNAGEVAPKEGVAIASQILRDLRGMVQGAYLMPPFGKYEMAAEIVDSLALRA
jgi:methionine synthase / methylenetetrahydrofolate reductase(NADPH)